MLLTITKIPTSNAGLDGEVCASAASYTIEAAKGASVSNNLSLKWTSSGTGTFTNDAILLATYTPSAASTAARRVRQERTSSG